MKKLSADKVFPIINIVESIEKIVGRRKLDKSFHRDEVEKYFSYLLQGKDNLDPYERRDAGVDDETWEKLLKDFNDFLGLNKKEDKRIDEKNIFDF